MSRKLDAPGGYYLEVIYERHHRLSGGGFAELIKELQPGASSRKKVLVVRRPDGEHQVIECVSMKSRTDLRLTPFYA
jgi:hypothetical protein